KVTLALAQDDKGLHIRNWVSPVNGKTPNPMPRPAFPAGTLFQLHVVYPPGWANWGDVVADNLPADAFSDIPAAQAASAKSMIKRAIHLIAGGDAVSFGLTIKEGKHIGYFVDQYAADINVADEIKSLKTDADALATAQGKAGDSDTISTYDAA